MRQKIENNLLVEVNGTSLNGSSNLEFYIKQGSLFFQYTPVVRDDGSMTVKIPYEDSMKLREGFVTVQLAFVDETGTPRSSDPSKIPVGEFLKVAGYDPKY